MKEILPAEDFAALPGQLAAAYGAFEGLGQAHVIGPAVIMQAKLAQANVLFQLVIDDNGTLQGIGLRPVEEKAFTLAKNEEEVVVGPYQLPGILTMPEGDKLPAVVLVHGSGPNDRDETAGGSAIFRDLAQGLSSHGIAVLRYDKRSYQMDRGLFILPAEEYEKMTMTQDTIEDAVAAVNLLKADPRIDPDRVFVIGHSQGAILAGRIQEEANASGLVLLAGTMRPLWQVVLEQLEAVDYEALGLDQEIIAGEIALARAIPNMTEAETYGLTSTTIAPYLLWEAAQHDLKAVYDACDAPMLILQGTEDKNVFPDRDYPLWEAFAKDHPEKDIELHLYEGLDHHFTRGDEVVFSGEALADIIAWILVR
ncbi:MAG: alpha/beta fold hydrolase [Firmicutes bacterium]|nr:alpha/beta fold hydrolase [Bacillota bacterium]